MRGPVYTACMHGFCVLASSQLSGGGQAVRRHAWRGWTAGFRQNILHANIRPIYSTNCSGPCNRIHCWFCLHASPPMTKFAFSATSKTRLRFQNRTWSCSTQRIKSRAPSCELYWAPSVDRKRLKKHFRMRVQFALTNNNVTAPYVFVPGLQVLQVLAFFSYNSLPSEDFAYNITHLEQTIYRYSV